MIVYTIRDIVGAAVFVALVVGAGVYVVWAAFNGRKK
jgi:hypothetical protein